MKRARSFARRVGAALLLLLLLWTASQLASRVPWIVALGTSVHTMGLGDYTADSLTSLAPLSLQILELAIANSETPSAALTSPTLPTAAPRPTTTPLPAPAPTPNSPLTSSSTLPPTSTP